MASTVALLLAATKSVSAAVLLFAWAAALAWRGTVDQPLISKTAYLTKTMFIPCLVFNSVASGMSMPFIRENWSLLLIGFLIMVTGFGVGLGLAVLLRVPAALRPWFVLAIAIPNMLALPLVLVEAICHEQELSASSVAVCVDGYTTRIFTVSLMQSFFFWILGPLYVRSSEDPGGGGTPAERAGLKDGAAREVAIQMAATEAAGDAEGGSGVAEAESEAGGAPLPETLGQPSPLLPPLAAGEEGNEEADLPGDEEANLPDDEEGSPPQSTARRTGCCAGACRRCWEILVDNPPIVANIAAVLVAAWPPLHRLFYAPAAPLSFLASSASLVGKASPAVSNIVTGGCFGLQLRKLNRDDPLGLDALGISRATMALLVLGRIVIAPLFHLLSLFLLMPIIPRDPWSRLTLVFQPAGVTGNIVAVLAQVSGQPEGAQLVALATIPQMMLYIPVSTALIAMGMVWGEGLES